MPKRAIGRRTESFSERTILLALNLLCRKRAIEQTGQSRFEKGTRPFRYRFYAEMSHWDEKKPTRYRAKAGPEVVLRKVSVLFSISSMPKRAIKADRAKSFSERTILFALNLLCRKRAIEQTGQSRFEKGTRLFWFIVSAVFSYGASHI